MSQPRYQIFVSSTFRDLQEERQAVLNAILKLNQFPAGMEIFPAVNDTAWQHIEKVIRDSDYYILIIGGKYGSIDSESGLSYTEKEYDFAVSQNIPVLAFVHSEPGKIAAEKVEMDSKIRKKLDSFKIKVGNKHHLNYWKTTEELKTNVITSLSQAIVINPQTGWIKAGGIEKNEILERLADLQQRYDNLTEENKKLKESVIISENEHFSQGDDLINLQFTSNYIPYTVKTSWNELLLSLGELLLLKTEEPNLHEPIKLELLRRSKAEASLSEEEKNQLQQLSPNQINISRDELLRIRNQFLALDIIEISSVPQSSNSEWKFTDKGRKLYLDQKAIRRDQV